MDTAVANVQIDSPRTRVTRWDLAQGTSTGPHVHPFDYIVVPLSSGLMRVTMPDGTQVQNQLVPGRCYARPAGTEHNVRNDDPEPVSFIEVELREHPVRPSALDEAGHPIGVSVQFTPPPPLQALHTQGRYVQVSPLGRQHAPGLWEAVRDDPSIWTYLPMGPCRDVEDVAEVIESFLADPGFVPHVLTDLHGQVLGTASYLRVQPQIGSAEVGGIIYGTRLQRTFAATEAMTLLAANAFELGYRRYEWKCDALNAASCAAALRLGFRPEGIWRNATMYKGRNRDTAWFAMTDDDWARIEPVHRAWLANTDPAQRTLHAFRLSEAVANALTQ
ncbi:GNAT family N-acetyltransferase [Gephyromycinifex aptenodytis]|uniref:GNAT family N-acetyltransferase n=1 Tax=Gephyromycinifex aptenodytis TaxID=2716227 RepID=UPI001B2FFFED|nr:GNAT family N-acetyltransferase [Gephyromycinifex aptenodytis]